MRPKQWRQYAEDCIRFYEKRRWNWLGAVGFICHCALGENMQREADAMARALTGIKYRSKEPE
jgi:hypothetical protein